MSLSERKFQVLKAIIESFIDQAGPVGSAYVLKHYRISVSPATIRNDMSYLEHMGLISQPHTSAGRIPTEAGLRLFVNELMDDIPVARMQKLEAVREFEAKRRGHREEIVHQAVSTLSSIVDTVCFATLPWRGEMYYLGISNMLHKPEFADSMRASTVIEVLEDKDHFTTFLSGLDIDERVKIFIGQENLLPQIQSCSLIVKTYWLDPKTSGFIGVLGPVRMRYSYAVSALKCISKDLQKKAEQLAN